MQTNFWQKLITIFWKQNNWHKHGVLIHTLKVTFFVIKNKQYKMIPAGLLHDIGKPATSKVINKKNMIFSFHWHEEKSYQIIKNWPFISEYTKQIVRWHYLIRWTKKALQKSLDTTKTEKYRKHWKNEHLRQKKIWEELDNNTKKDLEIFFEFDELWK